MGSSGKNSEVQATEGSFCSSKKLLASLRSEKPPSRRQLLQLEQGAVLYLITALQRGSGSPCTHYIPDGVCASASSKAMG